MHLRQVRVHKNTEINTVSIYPKKAFRNANNYMLLVLWYCLCDDVNWILSFAGENSSVCSCMAYAWFQTAGQWNAQDYWAWPCDAAKLCDIEKHKELCSVFVRMVLMHQIC